MKVVVSQTVHRMNQARAMKSKEILKKKTRENNQARIQVVVKLKPEKKYLAVNFRLKP